MLSETTINTVLKWRTTLLSKKGVVNQLKIPSERQLWAIDNPLNDEAKTELFDYYADGNGYKTIAKELNLSYTEIRGLLLRWTDLNVRKGMNVITDSLRKKRSDNAKGEKSNFYNWVEKYPERAKKQTKSIQGWYTNRNGEEVWLRSCLEYIYAKWLDSNNIDWKPEVQTFKTKQESYRPDFFIYENEKLIEVVEVKGNYFNNVDGRSNKAIRVCEEHKIKLKLVLDITPYLSVGSFYHKELKLWKAIQKQSAEKSSQSKN